MEVTLGLMYNLPSWEMSLGKDPVMQCDNQLNVTASSWLCQAEPLRSWELQAGLASRRACGEGGHATAPAIPLEAQTFLLCVPSAAIRALTTARTGTSPARRRR